MAPLSTPVMKAEQLFHQRIDYDDGAIVEMVLWRVPSPVPPSDHGLKYSLFYGRPGIREVGTIMNAAKATIGIFKVQRRATHSPASSS
jgi:hypothetical protein